MARRGMWKTTLRLHDIWRNPAYDILTRRDEIVRRIKTSKFWDEEDEALTGIVEELEAIKDRAEFDEVFGWFYDWADEHRVWVKVH